MNYYNEFDPAAADWLEELINQNLIPAGVVDRRSIVDVEPADLRGFPQCHFFAGIGGWPFALALAGVGDDEPLWTGSCPCPPFSAAGKGQLCPCCGGKRALAHPLVTAGWVCLDCRHEWRSDDRHLLPEFLRLIGQRRPSKVYGEQVASESGRLWFAALRAVVERLGYAAGAADLCAAGVGAPHIRQRLFWVADRCFAGLEGLGGHGDRSDEPRRLDAQPPRPVAEGGDAFGLAQPDSRQCDGGPDDDELLVLGPSPRRVEGDGVVAGGGGGGRLGDSNREPVEHDARKGRGRQEGVAGARRVDGGVRDGHRADGAPGGLDDADGARHLRAVAESEVDPREQARLRLPRAGRAYGRPDAAHGGWSPADWIFCRDGKWRPVESSVLGLADGVSDGVVSGSHPLAQAAEARTTRLRGYGNAIVPQLAAEFIRATR